MKERAEQKAKKREKFYDESTYPYRKHGTSESNLFSQPQSSLVTITCQQKLKNCKIYFN